MGDLIILTTTSTGDANWTVWLNLAVAIIQMVTVFLLIWQIFTQRKQNKIENKNKKLDNTYTVMENRLLSIMKLRQSINTQMKQDINKEPTINGKDKTATEKKKCMIDLYPKKTKYLEQYQKISELLNSYEYLCSAIEHKFIDEAIIKEQHKDNLIETYEDYKGYIEKDGKIILHSFNNVYNSWKNNLQLDNRKARHLLKRKKIYRLESQNSKKKDRFNKIPTC